MNRFLVHLESLTLKNLEWDCGSRTLSSLVPAQRRPFLWWMRWRQWLPWQPETPQSLPKFSSWFSLLLTRSSGSLSLIFPSRKSRSMSNYRPLHTLRFSHVCSLWTETMTSPLLRWHHLAPPQTIRKTKTPNFMVRTKPVAAIEQAKWARYALTALISTNLIVASLTSRLSRSISPSCGSWLALTMIPKKKMIKSSMATYSRHLLPWIKDDAC